MHNSKEKLISTLLAAAALLTPGPVLAEINVYLHSTVDAEGSLTLGDIASIDGGAGKSLGGLVIPPSAYADGYCDRKELEALLSGISSETVYVYGSAVRVTVRTIPEEKTVEAPADRRLVKAGAPVKVQVRKNNIIMELKGHAAQDGAEGDSIDVRIKGGRSLKGRLSNGGIVECSL